MPKHDLFKKEMDELRNISSSLPHLLHIVSSDEVHTFSNSKINTI